MAIKSTFKREPLGAFITLVRASMGIMVSTRVRKSVNPITGKGYTHWSSLVVAKDFRQYSQM